MADFMGKPQEFFTNVSIYDIVPKGLAHSYHEEDLSIIRTGKALNNIIEEVTTPLGERKWIRSDKKPYYDKNGNIKGVVIFSLDVTDRILAERKLRQNEELFRRIFDEAPYGVFIMDLSNKILHANASFCEQLGYGNGEINKMALEDISVQTEIEKVKNLYTILSPEITSITEEVQLAKKDGSILSTNLFATHIKNEDDIPMYYLGMVENISERREAEAKMMEYSNSLEESNKDLEQFAYIISHDLREPLRMMTSYTQLLKRRYAKSFDEAGNEFMDYIVDGAKRMDNLIKDLLSYSRVGRDKRGRTLIEIGEIINVVENNLRMSIQENKAQVIVKGVMPRVYGNKAQITTLIQNLINNAIKYRRQEVAPIVEIGVKRKDDIWEFYVKDNGIGIPVDHLETIFLIFQRLHSRDEYSGTGIGLAITKRIIQSHDGEIWVRSVEGEGSTFYFTIPIVNEEQLSEELTNS
jgi:PAS domain S-box-containing protein